MDSFTENRKKAFISLLPLNSNLNSFGLAETYSFKHWLKLDAEILWNDTSKAKLVGQ